MKPSTRAFLDSVRHGDDPSPADAARVRMAVNVALATGAASVGSAAAGSSTAGTAGAVTSAAGSGSAGAAAGTHAAAVAVGGKSLLASVLPWVGGGLTVIALSLGGYQLATPGRESGHREIQRPSPSTTIAAPLAPTFADPPEPPRTEPAAELPDPRSAEGEPGPPPRAPVASSSPVGPSLQADLDLLEAVSSDLRAGRAEQALERLSQRDPRIGSSVLSEELHAAHIVALCQTDAEQGRALARVFLDRSRHSPHCLRVQRSCWPGASDAK